MINNGTAYGNAYFELNYIRAFAVNSSVLVNANGATVSGSTAAGSGAPSATASGSGSGTTTGATTSGARALAAAGPAAWLAAVVGALGVLGAVVV